MDLKKAKEGPEAMPKFLIVMCILQYICCCSKILLEHESLHRDIGSRMDPVFFQVKFDLITKSAFFSLDNVGLR